MRISATRAVERALAHTRAILFQRFNARKWLGLSVSLFLSSWWVWWPDYGQKADGSLPNYAEWIPEHPRKFTAFLIGSLILITLSAWIQARARFIFLDAVIGNSGALRGPWRRLRPLGNSLFPVLLILLLLLATSFALGYFVFASSELGQWTSGGGPPPDPVSILIPPLAWGLAASAAVFLLYVVLGDFLVPIMYRRNVGPGSAFRCFLAECLPRTGALAQFVVLKFLLWCAAGLIMAAGACMTACVVALPVGLAGVVFAGQPWVVYLVSLPFNFLYMCMFLPIFVFFRLYSIYFLDQWGPEWWFFEREAAAGENPSGPTPGPISGPEERAGDADSGDAAS